MHFVPRRYAAPSSATGSSSSSQCDFYRLLLPNVTPPTLLCVLSAHYFMKHSRNNGGEKSTSCVPTTAAAAAAARPPPRINRSAVGAIGSCCRPFHFTAHTIVVLRILRCKVALSVLIEMLEKVLVRSYTCAYLDRLYFVTAVPGTYCGTTPCRNTVVQLCS